MPETRTHYQLSFTTKQAMAFFVLCLLALGLSFFFGLMAGLSNRGEGDPTRAPAEVPAASSTPREKEPAASSPAPAPAGPAEAPPSQTTIRDPDAGSAPTPPAVLQAFEDRGAEEPTPAPAPAATRAAAPAAPAAAGIWVQVASLSARGEADSLAGRLSRHGFHAQIAPAQGQRGEKLYRVRVGPYRTEEEARRKAEALRRDEKIAQPWIVRDGH